MVKDTARVCPGAMEIKPLSGVIHGLSETAMPCRVAVPLFRNVSDPVAGVPVGAEMSTRGVVVCAVTLPDGGEAERRRSLTVTVSAEFAVSLKRTVPSK